jgi:DHA1 family bicyclomycin/chloramphenicol resistance-like MFS transporter
VTSLGTQRLLFSGTLLAALTGIILAIASLTDSGGVWGIAVPIFLYVAVNGFIIANSIAQSLSNFSNRAGAAAAVIGAIQYGGGMFGSALVGAFADGTPFPMGLVVALAGIGSLVSVMLAAKVS